MRQGGDRTGAASVLFCCVGEGNGRESAEADKRGVQERTEKAVKGIKNSLIM